MSCIKGRSKSFSQLYTTHSAYFHAIHIVSFLFLHLFYCTEILRPSSHLQTIILFGDKKISRAFPTDCISSKYSPYKDSSTAKRWFSRQSYGCSPHAHQVTMPDDPVRRRLPPSKSQSADYLALLLLRTSIFCCFVLADSIQ